MCFVQLQPCLILFLRVWVLFAPLRRGSWNPTSLNSLPEIFSSSNMICTSYIFTSFTIRCITPASQLPSALNVEVWSLSTFGIVRPRRDPLAYETNDPDLYSVEHPPTQVCSVVGRVSVVVKVPILKVLRLFPLSVPPLVVDVSVTFLVVAQAP